MNASMKKIILALIPLISICFHLPAQTRIVGHRGYHSTGDSYENTVSALRNCQRLGVYAMEFDVNMTSDDSLVVFHGPMILKTGLNIQKTNFKEVRSVRLPDGEQIPTLREFLKVAKESPMQVICEIKTHYTKERDEFVTSRICALADELGMGSQLEFTSFSEWACDYLAANRPGAEIIYISSNIKAMGAAEARKRGYTGISYDLKVFQARPELFSEARAEGIKTTYWTPDNASAVWWGIEHKPDFISSNHPDRAKALLDAYNAFNEKVTGK